MFACRTHAITGLLPFIAYGSCIKFDFESEAEIEHDRQPITKPFPCSQLRVRCHFNASFVPSTPTFETSFFIRAHSVQVFRLAATQRLPDPEHGWTTSHASPLAAIGRRQIRKSAAQCTSVSWYGSAAFGFSILYLAVRSVVVLAFLPAAAAVAVAYRPPSWMASQWLSRAQPSQGCTKINNRTMKARWEFCQSNSELLANVATQSDANCCCMQSWTVKLFICTASQSHLSLVRLLTP